MVLEGEERRVTLTGVTSRPVVSALRGFSAPVELSSDARPGDRYVQLAGDSDLFNRWEAGQEVARDLILARAGGAPDEVGEEPRLRTCGSGEEGGHALRHEERR